MRYLIIFLSFCNLLIACTSTGSSGQAGSGDTSAINYQEAIMPEGKKPDIVDYYHLLKGPAAPEATLKKVNGKWVAQSISGQDLDPTVDIQNDFIEIKGTGVGSGSSTTQLTLFKMWDGQIIIGVNKIEKDATSLTNEYTFLEYDQGKWIDKTKHTVPNLSPYDFLPGDSQSYPAALSDAMPIYIEFSEIANNITAYIFTAKESLYCSENASPKQKEICPAFKKLQRKKIVLQWNDETGKFMQ